MSYVKRGGTTYTRVMAFKMAKCCDSFWYKKYGGTDRINVPPNVHVEVSHANVYGTTPS
jgi:hypothetical protein